MASGPPLSRETYCFPQEKWDMLPDWSVRKEYNLWSTALFFLSLQLIRNSDIGYSCSSFCSHHWTNRLPTQRHWQRAAWPFQCTWAPAATPLPATWTFYPSKFTPSHKGIANFSTDLFFLDVGGFSSLPTVSAIYFHYSFLPPPSISYVFTPHYVCFTLTYAAIWLEDTNALSVPWYFCPLLSFFFLNSHCQRMLTPFVCFLYMLTQHHALHPALLPFSL